MHRIAICIPTYKRLGMLEKLIDSIYACKIDTAIIKEVDIIIVDNDAEKTAEQTVARLAQRESDIFTIVYHGYPIKGLVNVRNELINQALLRKPDFLAFIDDDEFASPEWLSELIRTLVVNNGDLGVGPVIPVFEKKVPPYISHWFRYHHIEDQTNIEFIETGNLVARAQFLLDTPDMRFDQRFNTTGAEDSYFGVTALKKGTKIWWAGKAVAYETIPEKRATINWLLKRAYRGAITYTFIIMLEKKYLSVIKKVLVNILYLFVGIFALILTPFQHKLRYFGMMKIAESMGGFAGLLNLKYHEYAKGR